MSLREGGWGPVQTDPPASQSPISSGLSPCRVFLLWSRLWAGVCGDACAMSLCYTRAVLAPAVSAVAGWSVHQGSSGLAPCAGLSRAVLVLVLAGLSVCLCAGLAAGGGLLVSSVWPWQTVGGSTSVLPHIPCPPFPGR